MNFGNDKQHAGRYSFYAEQVAQVMAQNGLIFEEETPEMTTFIRGCA